jgi:hypothetical protein
MIFSILDVGTVSQTVRVGGTDPIKKGLIPAQKS